MEVLTIVPNGIIMIIPNGTINIIPNKKQKGVRNMNVIYFALGFITAEIILYLSEKVKQKKQKEKEEKEKEEKEE